MDYREAIDLANRVEREEPTVRVIGFMHWPPGSNGYEIVVLNTTTADKYMKDKYVVRSDDDWEKRRGIPLLGACLQEVLPAPAGGYRDWPEDGYEPLGPPPPRPTEGRSSLRRWLGTVWRSVTMEG